MNIHNNLEHDLDLAYLQIQRKFNRIIIKEIGTYLMSLSCLQIIGTEAVIVLSFHLLAVINLSLFL